MDTLVTYACVTHAVRVDHAHKKAITRIPQMYYTCIRTAVVKSKGSLSYHGTSKV